MNEIARAESTSAQRSELSISLTTLLKEETRSPVYSYTMSEIMDAPHSLKMRLLELGLTRRTSFTAEAKGARVLIRLRGDKLLLRDAEAQYIYVEPLHLQAEDNDES